MRSASSKIVYNKQRIKKDGSVLLYQRVIINRERKDIDLKIYWPSERFDLKKEKCLPRFEDDKLCDDYNIILLDAESKATEIIVSYRLKRQTLSLHQFLLAYNNHNFLSNSDFLTYYERKANQRYRSGDIEESTRDNHISTLNKLKEWKKTFLFSDMNSKTANAFDTWLFRKTPCKSLNGRAAHHKNFKTYLNFAQREDQVEFVNPYHYFKLKHEMGRYQPLTKAQFIQLYDFYFEIGLHPSHRKVLRSFLFACVTGMRHSDVRRFNLDWIDGEMFDFIPFKTRRYGTRVRMPITKEAMNFIADEIDEQKDKKLFCSISEQKDNEYIKEIADLLDIKMKICFQVARETFATLYMEHDGKLEVLASFLGHTSTIMSEKYVKIMDNRAKSESLRISNFTKETET